MKVWAVYRTEEHVGSFLQKLFASKESAEAFAVQQQAKSDGEFARLEMGDGYENDAKFFVKDEEIHP